MVGPTTRYPECAQHLGGEEGSMGGRVARITLCVVMGLAVCRGPLGCSHPSEWWSGWGATWHSDRQIDGSLDRRVSDPGSLIHGSSGRPTSESWAFGCLKWVPQGFGRAATNTPLGVEAMEMG